MTREQELTLVVMFTGSTRVGRIVATAAAKTLTPTTLEVGHAAGCTLVISPGQPVDHSHRAARRQESRYHFILRKHQDRGDQDVEHEMPVQWADLRWVFQSIRLSPWPTLMREVAPDYILCARDRVDDLVREFQSA